MLFLCVAIGMVIGFVLVFSSSNFVTLLTSSNKKLYNLINGTADYMGLFWKKFMSFVIPTILLFLLSLNYYLSFCCYLFITYQMALFVLSGSAVVQLYAMSGFLNVLFFMLPINLVFFAVMFYEIATVLRRVRSAYKYKDFSYGFDEVFWIKLGVCVLVLALLSFCACVVIPLFLKNATFIIF